MKDIFLELGYIENELEEANEFLKQYNMYLFDFIYKGYDNIYSVKYEDTYLDYMDYIPYNKVVVCETAKISTDVVIENKSIENKIKELSKLRKYYINLILSLSTFHYSELFYVFDSFNCLSFVNLNDLYKNIEVFVYEDNVLKLNPLIDNIFTIDMLDFIKFCINLRANEGYNYSIEDMYNLYKNEIKTLNLV